MPEDPIGQDEIERLLAEAQKASGQQPTSQESTAKPAPPQESTPPSSAAPPAAAEAPSPAAAKATLDQSELDAMLGNLSAPPVEPPSHPSSPTPPPSSSAPTPEPTVVTQNDIELLLNQAEDAIASIDSPTELPPGIEPFQLDDFGGTPANTESATLELVRDVELDMKIELGRTHMHLEDVLRLSQGAVVALDKLAGDPVDLFVNGRKIARGEVLVLNDNFCVRITELIVGDNACA